MLALEALRVTEVPPGFHSLGTCHIVDETRILAKFLRELLILFNLFLGVPEPLVNLLLLEAYGGDKFKDLGTLRRLASQLLEELPEFLALVPVLALPSFFGALLLRICGPTQVRNLHR